MYAAATVKARSFNSQPPEGGWEGHFKKIVFIVKFQLTAARRRLVGYRAAPREPLLVSTHSRPKAAGP